MTSEEIMIALISGRFSITKWLVIPNLSWGFGLNHECDLFVVSQSGYASEIEIKVSVQDVKRDLLKPHQHNSRSGKIKYLWFALPHEIYERSLEYIPERAGIITIKKFDDGYIGVYVKRKPKQAQYFRKLKDTEIAQLQRLMAMRYWSLLKKTHQRKGK